MTNECAATVLNVGTLAVQVDVLQNLTVQLTLPEDANCSSYSSLYSTLTDENAASMDLLGQLFEQGVQDAGLDDVCGVLGLDLLGAACSDDDDDNGTGAGAGAGAGAGDGGGSGAYGSGSGASTLELAVSLTVNHATASHLDAVVEALSEQLSEVVAQSVVGTLSSTGADVSGLDLGQLVVQAVVVAQDFSLGLSVSYHSASGSSADASTVFGDAATMVAALNSALAEAEGERASPSPAPRPSPSPGKNGAATTTAEQGGQGSSSLSFLDDPVAVYSLVAAAAAVAVAAAVTAVVWRWKQWRMQRKLIALGKAKTFRQVGGRSAVEVLLRRRGR
jgi:hypothetical protein